MELSTEEQNQSTALGLAGSPRPDARCETIHSAGVQGTQVHVGVQLGITHVLPSLCLRQPAALPSRTLHQFVSPGFLRPRGEEEAKVTICHHTRLCVGTPTARGQPRAAFLVHSGSPRGFCGLRDSIGVPRPSLCFPGPAGRSEPRPLARRLGPHCTVSPSPQHPCTSSQPDEGLPAQGTLVVPRTVSPGGKAVLPRA